MGVYNCAATLPAAIDSILAQTFADWELVVCDDCSTDHTYAIARRYAGQYPERIILLRNGQNSKLSYSLNRCLAIASGEYIARMDGDDRSCPERLARQVSFLEAHPEFAVVGCAMRRFSESGPGDIDFAPERPDRLTLRREIPFKHATIMMRKSVYDSLGGYTVSPLTVRGQDLDLWYRFYAAGYQGANLAEPLYLVREDMAAIRRRSFKVRYKNFKVHRNGYRLLHYPAIWLLKPFTQLLLKSIVPYRAIAFYRKWQAQHGPHRLNGTPQLDGFDPLHENKQVNDKPQLHQNQQRPESILLPDNRYRSQ